MGSDETRLDVNKAYRTADSIRRAHDEIEYRLNRAARAVDNIGYVWRSGSADQFHNEWMEVERRLRSALRALDEVASDLSTLASNVARADDAG
jgi:WXG100 family type VII secretion target